MRALAVCLSMVALFTAAFVPSAKAFQEAPAEETPVVPEGPDYREIGDRRFDERDFPSAAEAYSQLSPIEIDPGAQSRLAVSYFMLGRERDAEGTFRLATYRGPENAAAYNNLGVLYYARGDFDDAEDRFKDAAQREPENRNIQDNLHAAKYARENGRQSRDIAEQLRLTSPLLVQRIVGDIVRVELLISQEVQAELEDLELRGDVFLARKMYEDAAIEYERFVRIDEYNPLIINKLGLAYLQLQELDDAEEQYRDALRVNPYYLPSLNNLGSVEQARSDYRRALGYYVDALEILPDYSVVLQNVGALYFAQEQYEIGLEFYIRALRSDPTLFDPSEGGLPTLAQATRSNEAMTNFYMAKLFANIGDADRTMSYLYRAVEEGFDDADLLSDSVFSLLAEDVRFLQLVEGVRSE
jgi:tetratricopeptide (TPR) repeat protein